MSCVNVNLNFSYVGCSGESRRGGNKEAEQGQVHRESRAGMDISDGGRGCWGMQLHASLMQT